MALALVKKNSALVPPSSEEDDLLRRGSTKIKNGDSPETDKDWPKLGVKESKQWGVGQSFTNKLQGIDGNNCKDDNHEVKGSRFGVLTEEEESGAGDDRGNKSKIPAVLEGTGPSVMVESSKGIILVVPIEKEEEVVMTEGSGGKGGLRVADPRDYDIFSGFPLDPGV
ncbi:hypothetical protein K1719_002310 [Acacia pycnantha]|nr:hypothetical protein K1719_002310 [Acacia pycnantha]